MPARSLHVLGMDPSLSDWGLAHGIYHLKTGRIDIKAVDLISTKKSTDKKVMRSNDDINRAAALSGVVNQYVSGKAAIFVEAPNGSQSSRAALGNGVCYGILGMLKQQGMPVFTLSERHCKKATIGVLNASKARSVEWAMDLHPDLNWPMRTVRGKTQVVAKAHHMADAIAAIYAGVEDEHFKQTLGMLLNIN